MNGGRFVGRVGGLAVALGVGVALASGHQAVAWAEEGSSPSAPSASAPPPSTAGAGDRPSTAPADSTADDKKKPSTGPAVSYGAEQGEPGRDPEKAELPPQAAKRPHRASSVIDDDDADSPSTHAPKRRRQPADEPDGSHGRPTRAPAAPGDAEGADPEPEKRPAVGLAVEAIAAPPASTQPNVTVTAHRVAPDNPAGQKMISTAAPVPKDNPPTVDEVTFAARTAPGLGSLAPDGPAAPAGPPLELAALAVAARLRTSERSTLGGAGNTVAPALLTAEPLSATTAFIASSAAPLAPEQPIGEPDPATGVVTGSVTGSVTATGSANNALSYTVVTGPTKGTVVLNSATGAYTYTPTRAARLDAGTTTIADIDTFTAGVSNGAQTTNTPVAVYVSPLRYAVTTSLPASTTPAAVAVGADGRMYVANTASWSVSVMNTATSTLVDANPDNWLSTSIPVGPWPGALALSPDGKRLYVANTGWMSVSVIDTTTYKVIDADPGNIFTNEIGVGSNPSALAFAAGGRLYVANRGSASVSVIDTTTNKRIDANPANPSSSDIAVGSSPNALVLQGTQLYVANRGSNTVSVIDTTTFKVTKTLTVGTQPSAMTLGPNGSIYVVNTASKTVSVIDTTTNSVRAVAISVGPAPGSIAFDALGNRVFVANGNDTVSIIDTATNTVTDTVAIDSDTAGSHAITVAPSGTVYVADTDDNIVRVLSLKPGQAHATIDLGIKSGAKVAMIPGAFGKGEAVFAYLKGALCAAPNVCVPISYMNTGEFLGQDLAAKSMDDGVLQLDRWIRSTPGKKIVMGHSLGSAIIYRWLRQYSNDPTAPPPSELSFITLGSSERSITGLAYTDPNNMYAYRRAAGFDIPADTPYHVVDGCVKWDGYCYWIPGDSRSARGQNDLHLTYGSVDLNDPQNEVVVTGNITRVLIPTPGWE